jgi:hypothetical protein
MNKQLKTVLLTICTLSLFVIALMELSGVSSTALFNKYGIETGHESHDLKNETGADVSKMPKTVMSFEDTKYSFGTITEGDIVKHAYKFKNTGDNPLLISRAQASCGCTVPSYPKEPIPPGGSGEIMVQFNSTGKPGHQQKNVLISSNAQLESISIGFDAEVKEK